MVVENNTVIQLIFFYLHLYFFFRPLSISDGVIAKNVELSQLKGFFPEQRIADVYSLLR